MVVYPDESGRDTSVLHTLLHGAVYPRFCPLADIYILGRMFHRHLRRTRAGHSTHAQARFDFIMVMSHESGMVTAADRRCFQLVLNSLTNGLSADTPNGRARPIGLRWVMIN